MGEGKAAMVNTRDCPELFGKKQIDAKKAGICDDDEDECNTLYDCGNKKYTLSQLCEMFPFCTKQQIESLMAQYAGEEGMIRLTKYHQGQEAAAKQREALEEERTREPKKQFEGVGERAFPKLSLEKEWELVDELDDWTKIDPMEKKKTWAERIKDQGN